MIELALCVPVLLLLFFGVVDLGRMFYAAMVAANAASAAAQYAASSASKNADTSGITSAAQAAAADILPISVSNSLFCQCGEAQQACGSPCASERKYVRVVVTKTFTSWFNYPLLPQSTQVGQTVTFRVK